MPKGDRLRKRSKKLSVGEQKSRNWRRSEESRSMRPNRRESGLNAKNRKQRPKEKPGKVQRRLQQQDKTMIDQSRQS